MLRTFNEHGDCMGHFFWGIARMGYAWREGVPIRDGQLLLSAERFLSPLGTRDWDRYRPLQDRPAMVELFANIEPTEEGIYNFVTQYGMLGLGEAVSFSDGNSGYGESIETWKHDIVIMQNVLRVAQALQDGEDDTLKHWFSWDVGPSHVTMHYHPDSPPPRRHYPLVNVPFTDSQLVQGSEHDGVLFSTPGVLLLNPVLTTPPAHLDTAAIAQVWLQRQINYRLTLYVGVSVEEPDNRGEGIALAPQIMPKNLCGALWLQLAYKLRGAEWYRQCPQCDQWFHVHAKARRANTTYCSTRCRVRASRQRQARAASGG